MARSVDEYLARLPKDQQGALEQLRQTIRAAVPEVEETIRTGVPAFRYHDKPLVSIGAAKRHVALYIMYGAVLKTHEDELKVYALSKPLPSRLVTKLVKARMTEIQAASSKR